MSPSVDKLLDAFARLPTMTSAILSPDGTKIAMYYDGTGRNELHVLDLGTDTLEQWSDGEVPRDASWSLWWGPDSERVFFHHDEGGGEQHDIRALDSDGAVETVVDMDGQALIHQVTDSALLFGSTRDDQMNLYRHKFDGATVTKLTNYDRPVWQAMRSPTRDVIAYETNETADRDNRDVYLTSVDGSDSRRLAIGDSGAETSPVGWGPGGDRLLVEDDSEDLPRAGIYHLPDDEVRWYGDLEAPESPVAFVDGGEHFVVERHHEAGTTPVLYDVESGTPTELSVPEGVSDFGTFPPENVQTTDGRIVFEHTASARRPELLAHDLESDENEVLLPAEYGDFDPEEFATAKYRRFRSDGVPETTRRAHEYDPGTELEVDALFYDSGERPSPLIVKPHGGPRSRDAKSFDRYTQVLTLCGYSVLAVNFRGSIGRGRAFAEEINGDWGGTEQGDIVTGLEDVLSTYDWIDEDRIAVFGGSYGGYSAYWQLLQFPEYYAAGVAWKGLTDLVDLHEKAPPHLRTESLERYIGTPDENGALYRERSPIHHVESLAAPLLIVHGVNDDRVPISQPRQFVEALEDAGYERGTDGEFEYRELGEEGHGSTDQEQKLRLYRLVVEFLDRRLLRD